MVAALSGLLSAAKSDPGTERDQFLILERPDHLMILNRYQQNLSPLELTLFRPFIPIRVVRARDLLGDGFTPCMRVEVEGAEYFLIRDSDGRLAGESRAGTQRLYHGLALLYDTVRVLTGGLRFVAADGRGQQLLRAGERLVRVFSSAGETYVRRTGHPPIYGWVTLKPDSERRQWSVQRDVPVVQRAIPARVKDSVEAALTRTNTLLSTLFSYFGTGAGRARETPRWHMETSPSMLRCTLLDGVPDRDFPESTRYLVRDFETFVLGTNLGVFRASGSIEIRPR